MGCQSALSPSSSASRPALSMTSPRPNPGTDRANQSTPRSHSSAISSPGRRLSRPDPRGSRRARTGRSRSWDGRCARPLTDFVQGRYACSQIRVVGDGSGACGPLQAIGGGERRPTLSEPNGTTHRPQRVPADPERRVGSLRRPGQSSHGSSGPAVPLHRQSTSDQIRGNTSSVASSCSPRCSKSAPRAANSGRR